MFQQYIWLNDKYVVQLTKSNRLGCQKVRQGPPQLLEQWELQRKASDHSTPPILTPCLQPKETQVNFCKGGDFSETVQRTPCKKMTTPPSPRFSPSNDLLPSVILIVPVPLTPSSLPFYPFILLSFYPCLNFLLPLLLLQTSVCSSCMARCASVSWKSTSLLFGQKICWQCCCCCRQFSMEGQLVHSPHPPHHICPAFRCDYDDHPGQAHHSVSW